MKQINCFSHYYQNRLIFLFLFSMLNGCYYTGTATILDREKLSLTVQGMSLENSVSTGESISFKANGGTGVFKFSDLGTGFINPSTGVYTVPTGINPLKDKVIVTDSVGNSESLSLNIQAFETKDRFNLSPTNLTFAQANAVTTDIHNNIFAIGMAYDTTAVFHWIVRKSSDNGQTWTTVDDFNLRPGKDAIPHGIISDSNGDLYVAGEANDTSSLYYRWVIRKSTDGGATWTTICTYYLYSNKSATGMGLAIDNSGNIFSSGYAMDTSSVNHWIILKSTDHGVTWNSVNDYNLSAGHQASATAVSIDHLGNIFAAGTAMDASNINHWIVRKSTDGGSTWNTVNDYNLSAGKAANANSIAIDSNNNIFVAGFAWDASFIYHWIVRKSTDGGSTWATVCDYNLSAGKSAQLNSITVDAGNNLYISGYAFDSSSINHWILRKSANAGASWTTIHDYSYVSGKSTFAYSFAIDSVGNQFVAGYGVDANNRNHWLVTRSIDNGATWTMVNDFNLSFGANSLGSSIISDSNGKLFTAGYAVDTTGFNHWIVRGTSDLGLSWTTLDDYRLDATKSSTGTGIVKDSANNIYAIGFGNDATNVTHWIVRKSSDEGATWNTVSDYNLSAGKNAYANFIFKDLNGNIYVVGNATDATNISHWVVRKSSNFGASWSTVNDYFLTAGKNAYAYSGAADSNGQIFVVGSATDASLNQHWVVRKSSDSGSTWTTIDDFRWSSSIVNIASAIAIGPTNDLIVIGSSTGSGTNYHMLTRKSSDGGTNWNNIDDFLVDAASSSYGNTALVDSSNQIYIAGYGTDSLSRNHWIVRKSTNQGSSWSTIEDITAVSKYANMPVSLSVCGQNQICVVGQLGENIIYAPSFGVRILSP